MTTRSECDLFIKGSGPNPLIYYIPLSLYLSTLQVTGVVKTGKFDLGMAHAVFIQMTKEMVEIVSMGDEVYFPPTVLELYPSINMSFEHLKVRVKELVGL